MSENDVLWLIFEVGHNFYSAVSLDNVVEIVPSVSLSPLPNSSGFLDGLANIRGSIIPIVNMRRVFQLEDRPINYNDHLIIVKTSPENKLGLRVDSAVELAELQLSSDNSLAGKALSGQYINGVAKHNNRLIVLHDPSSLLGCMTKNGSHATEPFTHDYFLQECAS